MKTKRQKHKAAKARSIAARAAKKLETKAGSESETDELVRTVEPPKKKPKLDLPSSPGKSVKPHPPSTKHKPDAGALDKAQFKRQHRSPKVSQAADSSSQPIEKRKKRKEVTNSFTSRPLQQTENDVNSLSAEESTSPALVHQLACSGRQLRSLFHLRYTPFIHCPTLRCSLVHLPKGGL